MKNILLTVLTAFSACIWWELITSPMPQQFEKVTRTECRPVTEYVRKF
jgi:hypothetical protein